MTYNFGKIKFEGNYLIEEQEVALDISSKLESLKIEALAGTGKTTILKAISKISLPDEKGLYLSFGKDIVNESLGAFNFNVITKTIHGLAFEYTGIEYANSGRLSRRLSTSLISEKFKIKQKQYGLPALSFCAYALEIVKNFCNSSDEHFSLAHTKSKIIEPLPEYDRVLAMQGGGILAMKIWNEMMDMKSNLPITHDIYLKKWALRKPVLDFDYIMFDEAQDANPLIVEILFNQNCQLIIVGDRFQQIYSWRKAINIMQTIEMKNTCSLTQSFRFGNEIAEIANYILQNGLNSKLKIKGYNKIDSKVKEIGKMDALICRTNSQVMSESLNLINLGIKVNIAGGVKPLINLLKSAKSLMFNKQTNNSELAAFKSWNEVIDYSKTPTGTDLRTLVNITEKYNISKVIESLKKVENIKESESQITITTAHKSKGKEWNRIQLSNDYPVKNDINNSYLFNDEEINLIYVATTRAKKELDINNCDAVKHFIY